MPDCKHYGGITREKLNHLRKDLASEGVLIPEGDDVEFKGLYGVHLRAAYDESQKTLKICITKKPFFVPESGIWKFIDAGTKPYAG